MESGKGAAANYNNNRKIFASLSFFNNYLFLFATLQMVMAKVDSFLEALINYDKENIHPEIIKAIQPYLKDPEFEPEFIRSKSGAAAGLCAWVINIIKFYEVFCDVEPKRKALAQANADLAAAQDKLSVIKRKVVVCFFFKCTYSNFCEQDD